MPVEVMKRILVGYQGGYLAGRLLMFLLADDVFTDFRVGLTDGVRVGMVEGDGA